MVMGDKSKQEEKMRKLVTELSDGKKYTCRTLPLTQAQALRKKMAKPESKDMRRLAELTTKEEGDDGLTAEETEEMLKLVDENEDMGIDDIIQVIRLSLSPQHNEFAYTKDEVKDKEIDEKIKGLVDLRDMQILSQFALSGTIPKEDSMVIPAGTIDLTVKPE